MYRHPQPITGEEKASDKSLNLGDITVTPTDTLRQLVSSAPLCLAQLFKAIDDGHIVRILDAFHGDYHPPKVTFLQSRGFWAFLLESC